MVRQATVPRTPALRPSASPSRRRQLPILAVSICAVTSGQGYTTLSSASVLTVNTLPTITPTSPLTAGTQNVAYNQSLASSGGSGSGYTYSRTSGTLPTGITISSAGALSGTPTAPGTYNFTVQVQDSNGCPVKQGFHPCHRLQRDDHDFTDHADAHRGSDLQPAAHCQRCGGSYVFTLSSGSLPAGLSMNSSGLVTESQRRTVRPPYGDSDGTSTTALVASRTR